ncbi:hypothetical protein E2C01_087619 [Portunus trituberculatus]|uniref:Uncharacterized protein n=1 Tax=Portunus trituberculatus TaxID=210409 RepID=A0A5B7JEJ2_PORTR|nr:hypothetical protein [Portunus trituberculatus]
MCHSWAVYKSLTVSPRRVRKEREGRGRQEIRGCLPVLSYVAHSTCTQLAQHSLSHPL